MTDPIPPVPVTSARRSLWDRVSIVWLVPLAALAIALGVAWDSLARTGPLIRIVFEEAAGVVPRETELRFRDVTVGLVERVQFTPDLSRVIVSVRVDPQVAPYVDADATFWVVRPVISTQGITGIETVLSGVFIEGVWDDRPGEPQDLYQGQASQPLLAAGQQGLSFTLRATDGLLTSAVALLYKGVEVGRVGEPRVSEDGLRVEAEAVVYAPYDRLVTTNTRFWDASGFSVTLGTGGAQVDFDSLASLLIGGIAFDTFAAGGARAGQGAAFDVHYDEATARDSLLGEAVGPVLDLAAVFEGSVSGLSTGAAVELDGLRIGEVTGISGIVDEARFGDADLRLQTILSLRPARFGLQGGDPEAALDWLADRVAEGMRARLVTGNLLTGGLKVQLLTVPDAPPATLDRSTQPYPQLPVTDSAIADVAATAQDTLARIDALPIEELMGSAIGFLDNASVLVGSPETRAVPEEVRALLAEVRGLTASPEVQALPRDIAAALDGLEGAVADARALLARVGEAQTVERLSDALASAQGAADRIGTAAEGVPALVDRLGAVAGRVEALDAETLVAEVTGLAADARVLLADPATQGLPARLDALGQEAQAALAEARATVSELRGTVEGLDVEALTARLDAALASAERAAASVETAAGGLPAIVERLDALAARVDSLPIEEVAEEIRALAASANAFVSSEATQAVPGDLSAALSEAEALLREAREGGVVANANAALASFRAAADSLPDLVSRAGVLIDQAGVAVAGLSDTSGVVRQAQAAIAEVGAAAQAVADLARAIERDPNSLIFGD